MKKTKKLVFNPWFVILALSFGLNVLALIYIFKPQINKLVTARRAVTEKKDKENLFDQINPVAGYEINASFGQLGPKMIENGVIDLEKFKQTYEQNGQTLTEEQLELLTKGSNKKVKITRDNSYFLLNFFWAAGLANKAKVLTEGDIIKYGEGQVGNFASTGGWSLAKSN